MPGVVVSTLPMVNDWHYDAMMDITHFSAHVGVAIFCGLIIGLERQWRQHPAGLRTNALVALGACLFASLALLFDEKESSPTRVAGQIVTGVGFLAGGVILRDGLNVKGLTTAATIWCTGAIGTLAGCGFTLFAVFSTVCVLFLNLVMHPLSVWVETKTERWKSAEVRYLLYIGCNLAQCTTIRSKVVDFFLTQPGLSLQSILQKDGTGNGEMQIQSQFVIKDRRDEALEVLMGMLQLEPGVNEIRWEKMVTEPSA